MKLLHQDPKATDPLYHTTFNGITYILIHQLYSKTVLRGFMRNAMIW